jgi:hypothetical protein
MEKKKNRETKENQHEREHDAKSGNATPAVADTRAPRKNSRNK